MVQIIIFSKDRAFQLDALLRSIKELYHVLYTINVLYTYSNSFYKCGYSLCQMHHRDINWVLQENFKTDTEDLINVHHSKYVSFFTDDDLIKRDVYYDETFKQLDGNANILTLSLRLGLHCHRNYVNNNETPPPKSIIWNWKNYPPLSDWGYPMSIQGNVFRAVDLKGYTSKLNYNTPNTLEGSMYHKPLSQPLMACYEKSKVVCLQINRVADSINRAGNVHQDYLNKMFLEGLKMKLQPIYDMPDQDSSDFETQVEFE